jgi:uncharacterized surface protein with fasciclin (FAS1) repeats
MRNQLIWKLLLGILFSLYMGCEEYSRKEKYQRPDWLPGKLYTAVSVQGNLSKFAECLRLIGLDTILDVSGCFTIFAPTDEAVEQYLAENQYASVSNIPPDELERITEFHIIQNPWSLEQLQSLGKYGWRTVGGANWNPYALKRQTIFKNPVEKYWIARNNHKEMILIDSTISNHYKKVFIGSRKYAPIFYDAYLEENNLTTEDFSFYFDRAYEPGNVYYAGAKIIQADIFAENGFVHIIDKVVSPMLNAQELLEREVTGETYRLFLEMVYWYYPMFEPNIAATIKQPGVRSGALVDTLWDLYYPELEFALHKESAMNEAAGIHETLVEHNGLFVPTDPAFREFIDGMLTIKSGFPHWHDYRSLPRDLRDIIITPHFKSAPIYPSTDLYQEIFREEGRFQQNEEEIIRKEFGSNCTFIGLSTYVPDRVFTSVTGPVFLRPTYSIFRQAILYARIQDVIANHPGELYFFPIPDHVLESDSSLFISSTDYSENRYSFQALDRLTLKIVTLGRNSIRNLILNQVGTPMPNGTDNKEIIETLRGNYITWDHSDNTIQGTLPSTWGYNGTMVKTCSPSPMNEPSDNGKTWSVHCWFNF